MVIRYVHLPEEGDKHVGEGIVASWEEKKISYDAKQVFYLLTEAVVDTACCGDRTFYYATVLGYIKSWQQSQNEAGLPISEMEPILDHKVQEEIEHILQQEYPLLQILFREH